MNYTQDKFISGRCQVGKSVPVTFQVGANYFLALVPVTF